MKIPALSRVKTRLAATIGDSSALDAYEMLVATTLVNLPVSPVRQDVHFDPSTPGSENALARWLSGNVPDFRWDALVPQISGDLGERLQMGSKSAWGRHPRPRTVTLIGTDCPRLRPRHFREAWAALDSGTDVVFGPALDGGYYLKAMKGHHPGLFWNIPWSTDQTLAVCLERCRELGLTFHLLEQLEDVDDQAAWDNWLAESAEM